MAYLAYTTKYRQCCQGFTRLLSVSTTQTLSQTMLMKTQMCSRAPVGRQMREQVQEKVCLSSSGDDSFFVSLCGVDQETAKSRVFVFQDKRKNQAEPLQRGRRNRVSMKAWKVSTFLKISGGMSSLFILKKKKKILAELETEMWVSLQLSILWFFLFRMRSTSQEDGTPGSDRGADFPHAGPFSPFPLSSRMHSSDSDYSGSDVEGGQAGRLRSHNSKVRHCALACFHAVIKVRPFL